MRPLSHLSCSYLPPATLDRQPAEWQAGVLGCALYSGSATLPTDPAYPYVVVSSPPLLGNDELCEVWHTDRPVTRGKSGSLFYSATDQLLFGALSLAEADFEGDSAATPLQRASELAFREIFELLDTLSYPFLLRVWNYFPQINLESHGLERYRQFNTGRQEGFQQRSRALEGNVPAACALGCSDGHLTIYFLAGREEPLPVENPRQISAYHYPKEYGPRSPTFSRANLSHIGAQEVLFISGTASIVGHRSEHIGDVVAQTRETMTNIEVVIAEANRAARSAPFALQALFYKVYVRHPADLPAIRRELLAKLGSEERVIYLRADVCREDLLVEIEASAGHPLEML